MKKTETFTSESGYRIRVSFKVDSLTWRTYVGQDVSYRNRSDAENDAQGMRQAFGMHDIKFDVIQFGPNIVTEKVPYEVKVPMTLPESVAHYWEDFKTQALRFRRHLARFIDPGAFWVPPRDHDDEDEDW